MKALTALACVVVLALPLGPATAKVSQGYWIITGPKVSSRREGWAVCRSIVAGISPAYKLYRVTVMSNRSVRCWYTT